MYLGNFLHRVVRKNFCKKVNIEVGANDERSELCGQHGEHFLQKQQSVHMHREKRG